MLMRAAGVALLLATTACNSVTPVPIRGGEVCYRCRRLILDTRVAAQTVGMMATNFRTAGCMAKYLAVHPEDTNATFVTDYESGKLIRASSAVFVPTVDPATNERDVAAYKNEGVAGAVAAAKGVTLLTWDELLEQAKGATAVGATAN